MVGLVREGKPVMVLDETEQTDEKTPACLIKQIAIQQPFPFSTGKKKNRDNNRLKQRSQSTGYGYLIMQCPQNPSAHSFLLITHSLLYSISFFVLLFLADERRRERVKK